MIADMLWPLLACFVLVGIHAYLGIHVMARKVIFVDLALAQIAALGVVYGVYLGFSFQWDPITVKLISIGFTLIGALLFALTRTHDERIPHEAIIGIIYASALSLTILLTGNLPHGSDEVTQMLAGSILWVTPKDVISTAVLYAGIGLIHLIFRRQFFLLSAGEQTLKASGLNVKFWDFLFYATFGVVVTSSVSMGGVLLVFGYLVIPSVIGIMLGSTMMVRLLIGWGIGASVSVIAVVTSFYLDINSGPTIVVMLAVLLLVIAIIRTTTSNVSRGLTYWIAGAAIVLLLVLGPKIVSSLEVFHGERHHQSHEEAAFDEGTVKTLLESGDIEKIQTGLKLVFEHRSPSLFLSVEHLLGFDNHDIKRSSALALLAIDKTRGLVAIKEHLKSESDEFVRIDLALALLESHDRDGLLVLADIVERGTSLFAKTDAENHIKKWVPEVAKHAKPIEWLREYFGYLKYDEERKQFISN